jgi:hypothetical protein
MQGQPRPRWHKCLAGSDRNERFNICTYIFPYSYRSLSVIANLTGSYNTLCLYLECNFLWYRWKIKNIQVYVHVCSFWEFKYFFINIEQTRNILIKFSRKKLCNRVKILFLSEFHTELISRGQNQGLKNPGFIK